MIAEADVVIDESKSAFMIQAVGKRAMMM